MGKTSIFLLVLIGIAALSLFNLKSNDQPKENLMFEIWKGKMNKQYD
jgi:hypothetical protein